MLGSEDGPGRGFRLAVLSHFAFGAVITMVASVVAFDAMAYAALEETVLIDSLGVLYAWVFVYAQNLFGTTSGVVAATSYILLWQLPFAVHFGAIVLRILRWAATRSRASVVSGLQRAGLLVQPAEAQRIQRVCCDVCQCLPGNSSDMDLHIVNAAGISIRGRLFAKTARLTVGVSTARSLSDKELYAAIAHEFGHMVQGLRKVEWLRLASALAMYPNYYLVVLLDTVGAELRADEIAVHLGASRKNLARAIVKTQLAPASALVSRKGLPGVGRQVVRWLTRETGFARAMRFFYGSAMVGSAYPVLRERLARLDNFSGAQGSAS